MIRGLAVAGIVAALSVLSLQEAAAKTIDIAYVSRSDMLNACLRARGSAYGIGDSTAIYGCYAGQTVISCTPDDSSTPDDETQCQASVADTQPLAGNSLGYILGFGKPAPASQMVAPVDARLQPDYGAQTGSFTSIAPIAPMTAPSTLKPWAPPFTDPYAQKPY